MAVCDLQPCHHRKLKGIIEHQDNRNLQDWWDKQNRCTTMEAIMRVRKANLAVKLDLFGTALESRMYLKKIFFHVPFRFQLLWLYAPFDRGAIWDGSLGHAYIHLRVEQNSMIELKVRDMRITGWVSEIPEAPRGDYNPRVLNSLLQKFISNDSHVCWYE